MKTIHLCILLFMAAVAGTAQADTSDTATSTHGLTMGTGALKRAGDAIRANHARTIHYTETWLTEHRFLQTQSVHYARTGGAWVTYRSPYARVPRLHSVAPGLYTLRAPLPYDFTCRFLADCPCRYLAGC
jgi:hypothetical protein